MKIFKNELKKLICCPFLWGLLLVFTAFDVVMLLNDLSPGNYDYPTMYEAIVGSENADEGAAEYYRDFYSYYSTVYDSLDMNEIFRQKMALYYPEVPQDSAYFRWAQRNYAELQERVESIRKTGEGNGDFYPGQAFLSGERLYMPAFRIHRRLCGLLSRSLLESMIWAALAVLYLEDFERVNAAEEVVFSTRQGRGVQLKKVLAGALYGLSGAAVLFGVPLGTFAAAVPMRGLWGTSVSAFALTEPTTFFAYPFVTWAKMSVLGQLAASLGLCAALVYITVATCAGAYFFAKNGFFVMLGAGVAFLGTLLLPFAVPAGVGHTLSMMSPAVLWYSAGMWFIEFDPARGRWFEVVTVAVWTAAAAGIMRAGWRRYGE